MASLKSVDNVPGIDYYEYRDNQYYSKYDYRLRINIPCLRYTYFCKKPEDLDNKLKTNHFGYYGVRKNDIQIVTDHLPALKSVIELQHNRKSKNIKVRVEGSTIAVFGNDLVELRTISSIIGTTYKPDYTQVKTSSLVGTKYFVNEPKHKYRVYLKNKRVADGFTKDMSALLKRISGLYPSSALCQWLTSFRYRWARASYFIDYDDESTLSYLALMHGDTLGKKYKLEKRPDPV